MRQETETGYQQREEITQAALSSVMTRTGTGDETKAGIEAGTGLASGAGPGVR